MRLKTPPSNIALFADRFEFYADTNAHLKYFDNSKDLFPPGEFKVDLKSIGALGITRCGPAWCLQIDGKDPIYGKGVARPDRNIVGLLAWDTSQDAQAFADAVNRLHSSVSDGDTARRAAWPEFQRKAAAWRALALKPQISEDTRRHKLLAEDAFGEKKIDAAVEEYEAGLQVDPTWTEGHFNAALLCAELGYYSDAVWHMRSYIELLPDAPDSQAARDKILVWEHKIGVR